MNIYFSIVRFNFQRFLAYPIEIWAAVGRRFIDVAFLLTFWTIIAHSSQGNLDYRSLISYFLVAGAINDLLTADSLRFGKAVGDSIKKGTINTYLIRPLSILPYLYATSLGDRSLGALLSAVSLIAGLALLPPSPAALALFLLFLVPAMAISVSVNLLVAMVYFYSPEAQNFRFTASHVIRVFSGAIVPISLFPASFKSLALFSPFAAMVYAPAAALHTSAASDLTWLALLASCGWALILPTVALLWWKKAITAYDAIGI